MARRPVTAGVYQSPPANMKSEPGKTSQPANPAITPQPSRPGSGLDDLGPAIPGTLGPNKNFSEGKLSSGGGPSSGSTIGHLGG